MTQRTAKNSDGQSPREQEKASLRCFAMGPVRGLAALWVFLLHYRCSGALELWQPDFAQRHPLLDHFLLNGGRAVPIFFVVSGYCMAQAAWKAVEQKRPVGEFIYRRVKRIYPAFWFSILLICFLKWSTYVVEVFAAGAVYAEPPSTACYSWLDWIKIASLTQIFDRRFGLLLPGRFDRINWAYWTLGIEFQFYLVVALAILCRRRFYGALAAVTLVAVPIYFIPSLSLRVYDSGLFLYYWLWFACGVALYRTLQRGLTPQRVFGRHAAAKSVAVIAAIVAAFGWLIAHNGGTEVSGLEWLTWAAGSAVLFWLGSAVDHGLRALCEGRQWLLAGLGKGLTTLGAMSYSLYLVHIQVSTSILVAVRHLSLHATAGVHAIVIVGTLLVSYVFYRFCERPYLATSGPRTAAPPVSERIPAPRLSTVRLDPSHCLRRPSDGRTAAPGVPEITQPPRGASREG